MLNVALFGEPDFLDPSGATSVGFVPIDNAYESLVSTERDTTKLVHMLIIPEGLHAAPRAGEGDIAMAMKFPAEALPALERHPDLQVIRAQGLRVLALRLQNAAPPTGDVRVRQAVRYAFGVQSFLKATEGTHDPPTGPVPAVFLGGWSPTFPCAYEPARARTLLREAGYSEARKARLVADVLIATPDRRKAAEILQRGLAATGPAELEIRENEWPVMMRPGVTCEEVDL